MVRTKTTLLLGILPLLLSSNSMAVTNWYVNQSTGSNSNNGTSPATPFKTVEYAADQAQPADTIFIMGEYANASYDANYSYTGDINDPQIWTQENSFKINNLDGAAGQYITLKPYNSSTVLKGDGANIARITNCSYLRIEGFNIYGEVEDIPYQTAVDLQFLYREQNSSNTLYRVPLGTPEECIDTMTFPVLNNITRPSYTDTRGIYASNCHHLDVVDNIVHHTPGNGLRVAASDYVNVTGNEVHDCARKSSSGTHGLVISESESYDNSSATKIFVTHNLVDYNYNEIYSWSPNKTFIVTHIDEGKGISLQKNDSANGWTDGRILVANNIAYWNGYSGVHANTAERIDFINNTAYKNFYTEMVTYGNSNASGNFGFSFQEGDDVKIINNIAYTDAGVGYALAAANTTDLVVTDNVVLGTIDSDVDAVDVNTTFADPLFVNGASFDFNLQSTSPAIGIADETQSPDDDFFEVLRDVNPDIGATEYVSPLPVELLFFTARKKGNGEVELEWATASERNHDHFLVEKSGNAKTWKALEKISGKGNASQPQSYSALDSSPFPGMNYYRLKQVGMDGSFSWSPIRTVLMKPENEAIKIYPNPVSRNLFIEGDEVDLDEMEVFNMQGQNVTSLTKWKTGGKRQARLDVSGLPRGAYFLRTKTDSVPFYKR